MSAPSFTLRGIAHRGLVGAVAALGLTGLALYFLPREGAAGRACLRLGHDGLGWLALLLTFWTWRGHARAFVGRSSPIATGRWLNIVLLATLATGVSLMLWQPLWLRALHGGLAMAALALTVLHVAIPQLERL